MVGDVLAKVTSKSLEEAGEHPTSLEEMYCCIELMLVMATVNGFSKCQFFSNKESYEIQNPFPFKLNEYMAAQQMELLDQHISFTDKEAPVFTDKFLEIRQMLEAWHTNTHSFFIPSWIVCLNKSMSIWTSQFIRPGPRWVFFPHKPHPVGTEVHSICCGKPGILVDLKMNKGGV